MIKKKEQDATLICQLHDRREKPRNYRALYFCTQRSCPNSFVLQCLRCRNQLHREHSVKFITVEQLKAYWCTLASSVQRRLQKQRHFARQLQAKIAHLQGSRLAIAEAILTLKSALVKGDQEIAQLVGRRSEAQGLVQQFENSLLQFVDSETASERLGNISQSLSFDHKKSSLDYREGGLKEYDERRQEYGEQMKHSVQAAAATLTKSIQVLLHKEQYLPRRDPQFQNADPLQLIADARDTKQIMASMQARLQAVLSRYIDIVQGRGQIPQADLIAELTPCIGHYYPEQQQIITELEGTVSALQDQLVAREEQAQTLRAQICTLRRQACNKRGLFESIRSKAQQNQQLRAEVRQLSLGIKTYSSQLLLYQQYEQRVTDCASAGVQTELAVLEYNDTAEITVEATTSDRNRLAQEHNRWQRISDQYSNNLRAFQAYCQARLKNEHDRLVLCEKRLQRHGQGDVLQLLRLYQTMQSQTNRTCEELRNKLSSSEQRCRLLSEQNTQLSHCRAQLLQREAQAKRMNAEITALRQRYEGLRRNADSGRSASKAESEQWTLLRLQLQLLRKNNEEQERRIERLRAEGEEKSACVEKLLGELRGRVLRPLEGTERGVLELGLQAQRLRQQAQMQRACPGY